MKAITVVCRLCFDAWAWNADGVVSAFIQRAFSFFTVVTLSLSHIFPHHSCVSHYNRPFNLLTKDNPTKHQPHTHTAQCGAGLIHPSPCGKVPLTASCAQGLYFHTSIMETPECSTANAMVTLNRSGWDDMSCCQIQERPADSIGGCAVTTK